MPLNISYMGSKRKLAGQVAEVIENASAGPMLDLFSGMCAIGSAVAPSRNIWCNDAQRFASTVATSFFMSERQSIGPIESIELVRRPFERNYEALENRFKRYLAAEEQALSSICAIEIYKTELGMPNCAQSNHFARERAALAKVPNTFPYRLFSIAYAGGYVGLRQSIEIDSLRYAIDISRQRNRISIEQHRWFLIALSSPGLSTLRLLTSA